MDCSNKNGVMSLFKIKTSLKLNNNVDISKYTKRQSVGYKLKKPNAFTRDKVNEFFRRKLEHKIFIDEGEVDFKIYIVISKLTNNFCLYLGYYENMGTIKIPLVFGYTI